MSDAAAGISLQMAVISAQDITAGARRRLSDEEREVLAACDLAAELAAEFVNERQSPYTRANYLSVISEWLAYCRERL